MVKDLQWTFLGKCIYLFRCQQRYGPWIEHRSFHPKNHFCAQAVTKSANHLFSNCLQLLVSFMVKRIHFCPFGGGFFPKVRLLGIQGVVLRGATKGRQCPFTPSNMILRRVNWKATLLWFYWILTKMSFSFIQFFALWRVPHVLC